MAIRHIKLRVEATSKAVRQLADDARVAKEATKELAQQSAETTQQIGQHYNAVQQYIQNTHMVNLHDIHTSFNLLTQMMQNIKAVQVASAMPSMGAASAAPTTSKVSASTGTTNTKPPSSEVPSSTAVMRWRGKVR